MDKNESATQIWAEASKSTVKSMLLSSAVAFKELEMKRCPIPSSSLLSISR